MGKFHYCQGCIEKRDSQGVKPDKSCTICKEERKAKKKEYLRVYALQEHVKASKLANYYKTRHLTKDARNASSLLHRNLNIEKYLKYSSDYSKNNRAKCNARLAEYKAKKKKATPAWADVDQMEILYAKSRRLTVWCEIDYEVDHIVPITSDLVCGLHCQHNLRIITQSENGSKGNHWWPDMW